MVKRFFVRMEIHHNKGESGNNGRPGDEGCSIKSLAAYQYGDTSFVKDGSIALWYVYVDHQLL